MSIPRAYIIARTWQSIDWQQQDIRRKPTGPTGTMEQKKTECALALSRNKSSSRWELTRGFYLKLRLH